MELRHLRYFLAVGEALNFTRAAAQLRVAQPALSRQVQDLEDEIGVDLLRRSPRGVTLTAEGKLFLDEVRELLKRADESVEKVRALARGEYGELHVGYAPSPTVAMTATHPFARLKSVSLDKLAAEPLVGLRRKDYSEYYRIVDRVFSSVHAKPRIAVECDSASSLITEVEAG